MTRSLRLFYIGWVLLRHGIDQLVLSGGQYAWVRLLARLAAIGRPQEAPRGVRLRLALEQLGPIFV